MKRYNLAIYEFLDVLKSLQDDYKEYGFLNEPVITSTSVKTDINSGGFYNIEFHELSTGLDFDIGIKASLSGSYFMVRISKKLATDTQPKLVDSQLVTVSIRRPKNRIVRIGDFISVPTFIETLKSTIKAQLKSVMNRK